MTCSHDLRKQALKLGSENNDEGKDFDCNLLDVSIPKTTKLKNPFRNDVALIVQIFFYPRCGSLCSDDPIFINFWRIFFHSRE